MLFRSITSQLPSPIRYITINADTLVDTHNPKWYNFSNGWANFTRTTAPNVWISWKFGLLATRNSKLVTLSQPDGPGTTITVTRVDTNPNTLSQGDTIVLKTLTPIIFPPLSTYHLVDCGGFSGGYAPLICLLSDANNRQVVIPPLKCLVLVPAGGTGKTYIVSKDGNQASGGATLTFTM